MAIRNSHKMFALGQRMGVDTCSIRAKSRNYESQMLGGEFVIIAFA
jgi:hypothetical protein